MLTNADLEAMVTTTNEWIFERTGVRERHIVEGDEVTSGMAAKTSREALARVNFARFGSTSVASILIALCDAVAQGRVRQGDALVLRRSAVR